MPLSDLPLESNVIASNVASCDPGFSTDRVVFAYLKLKGNPLKEESYLTPKLLAQRWKFNVESVRRKIRRGEIPSMIIGGRRLISLTALEEIENASQVLSKGISK